VVWLDESGDRVVSPAVGVGAGSGAVDSYCWDAVMKVCGNAVDVWAVDSGGVVDRAIEVGVLE